MCWSKIRGCAGVRSEGVLEVDERIREVVQMKIKTVQPVVGQVWMEDGCQCAWSVDNQSEHCCTPFECTCADVPQACQRLPVHQGEDGYRDEGLSASLEQAAC